MEIFGKKLLKDNMLLHHSHTSSCVSGAIPASKFIYYPELTVTEVINKIRNTFNLNNRMDLPPSDAMAV